MAKVGRPRKQINLEPPPREEQERLLARRSGLKDDPRNIARRRRYAATERLCECGNDLRPKYQYCDVCAATKLRRVCKGWNAEACDLEPTPGKQRCPGCWQLHRDEVREAKNERRRAGNGRWKEQVDQ